MFFGVFRPRARVEKVESVLRYIDYQTNELVEEKEYVFCWAHLLGFIWGRHVNLPKFKRDSTLQIFCKPPVSYKQALLKEYYEKTERGKHQFIRLADREYFENEEIDRIYVQCNSPQGQAYKANITSIPQAGGVMLENRNREKIRNYILVLPDAGVKDIPALLKYGGALVLPEQQSQVHGGQGPPQSQGIAVTIGEIGEMQGNIPGRLFVSYGNN